MLRKIWIVLLMSMLLISPVYGASEWAKIQPAGTASPSDIDTLVLINNEALDRVLTNFREGAEVTYASATTLTVLTGEVVCSNSGGTLRRMRKNTSNVTVTWGNIDAGAEESSTTYYVWAIADADATTFTILVSKSSSAPTGGTYYAKLGSFYNNSSGDIDNDHTITNDHNYYGLVLGAWVSKSNNTEYAVTTDGTVVASSTDVVTSPLIGLTDSSSPPTTQRQYYSEGAADGVQCSLTMPVKKGDNWKVTGATTVYWIPNE